MQLIDSLYAAVARGRRRWYESNPARRRVLDRPVVSIGSLSAGGSGKTPLAACVARLLREAGERPAILSRGYARQAASDGVTVVRDFAGIRTDVEHAGDEPMMLARALEGVAVVVDADRYLAGRLAEGRLGATVHLLDDGFQHLQLARDVDLLVMRASELDGAATFPSGRLREPVAAATRADALLLSGASESEEDGEASSIGIRLGVPKVFEFTQHLGPAVGADPADTPVRIERLRVYCVAGIAAPDRFFEAVRERGAVVAATRPFPDHHPFSRAEIDEMAEAATAGGAEIVLTTEKDLERMLPHRPWPFRLATVPLVVEMPQREAFGAWLMERLDAARHRRLEAARGESEG
ncbi:MAG: tetraacyldisaccharide 4'-kinase [Vicinamibacterales bacterium]|nr:tetraacyldisaccharide 4'-kinase [Vicinamibacterales bacterium]MDP6610064.1 tetraacyldisaccharide 4'-kinase [Vicinamibacterales bacterium]